MVAPVFPYVASFPGILPIFFASMLRPPLNCESSSLVIQRAFAVSTCRLCKISSGREFCHFIRGCVSGVSVFTAIAGP